MKTASLFLILILSGCAIAGNALSRGGQSSDLYSMTEKGCKRVYDKNICKNIGKCVLESKNIRFTKKQLGEYSFDVDYGKNIYKNDDYSESLYNIWHPEEIVYKENNEKHHAQLRKKEKNFQILRNEIQRCFSENGMDVYKVLNSYKP